MNVIRMFITSAVDKNDRILGAMYVVSALTLVNEQARNAYPWLYESVFDDYVPHNTAPPITLGNYFGAGFWSNLLAITARNPPISPPLLSIIFAVSSHICPGPNFG